MKEKIYTIPVNEAFDNACSCPFCQLMHKLETQRVSYTLGASMMESDAREITNTLGFCPRHLKMLFNSSNKLSLALILDTHLQTLRSKINASASCIGDSKKKSPLFKKNKTNHAAVLSSLIDTNIRSCAICKNIEHTMERYIDVFFYMWKNEPEFKEKFDKCNSICLMHYGMLTNEGERYLSSSDFNTFISSLIKKEDALLSSLNEDIHKFTLKFDYRNKDMPWGSAKDAPKRVIEYLSGECMGDDDNEQN